MACDDRKDNNMRAFRVDSDQPGGPRRRLGSAGWSPP